MARYITSSRLLPRTGHRAGQRMMVHTHQVISTCCSKCACAATPKGELGVAGDSCEITETEMGRNVMYTRAYKSYTLFHLLTIPRPSSSDFSATDAPAPSHRRHALRASASASKIDLHVLVVPPCRRRRAERAHAARRAFSTDDRAGGNCDGVYVCAGTYMRAACPRSRHATRAARSGVNGGLAASSRRPSPVASLNADWLSCCHSPRIYLLSPAFAVWLHSRMRHQGGSGTGRRASHLSRASSARRRRLGVAEQHGYGTCHYIDSYELSEGRNQWRVQRLFRAVCAWSSVAHLSKGKEGLEVGGASGIFLFFNHF